MCPSFFKKLKSILGENAPKGSNDRPQPGKSDSKRTQILEELRSLVNRRGHTEYFCLSKVYSPGSRMPAIDFSFWIKEKIKRGDKEALKVLLWELIKGNPGLCISTGGDDDIESGFFKSQWEINIDRILEVDLSKYVIANDDVINEIKTIMFLAAVHNGSLDGFILTTEFPLLLGEILMPWEVRFKNIEPLVDDANKFIRRMKKDTDYWKYVELFNINELPNLDNVPKNINENLCKILQSLPLSTRLHLYDVSGETRHGKNKNKKPLDKTPSHGCYQLGIDARESSQLLVQSGLVQEIKDTRLFLLSINKGEISMILANAGVSFKKSWPKDKLIDAAINGCREIVDKLGENTYFGDVNPRYIESLGNVYHYLDQTIDYYKLILSFSIAEGRT